MASAVAASELIKRGFTAAADAVKFDEAGNIEAAIASYQTAVSALREALREHPTHPKADSLATYTQNYEARCSFLTTNGAGPEAGASGEGSSTEAAVAAMKALEPPAESLRRPFWLMCLLLRSIKSGGWITPHIYAPSSLWTRDAKLPDIPAKVRGLGKLLDAFKKAESELQEHSAGYEDPSKLLVTFIDLYRALAEVAP